MTLQANIFAFRNRFPEFKDVDEPIILNYMDFATTQLDKETWDLENDYERGILLLAAHLVSKHLQLAAQSSDGSGATDLFVSSIHFGERTVSFGRRGEADSTVGALGVGERALDDTMYGQMFLQLRSRNVIPVVLI